MKASEEARFYDVEQDGSMTCSLCPHRCRIQPGQRGLCRTRINQSGKLLAQTYGRIASYGKDPIEKKPLYHYYPGSRIFSIGSYGCNFSCDFCQNFSISQETPSLIDTSPHNLADIAANESNNLGVAYTYNEPTVWYEFMTDIAREVRSKGLKNVMVTNGYMNPEPLEQLLPLIDAMNIDLKSMSGAFYEKYCGGKLDPVLEFIRKAADSCHIEITTLLIDGLNTDPEEMDRLAQFIASIRPTIPLHLSRFFPAYKRQEPPTDLASLDALKEIAGKHLKYVYIGNVPEYNRTTECPSCGKIVVDRSSEGVHTWLDKSGFCGHCGSITDIITGERL